MGVVRVKHSGDLGDLIYAMPVMRRLGDCQVSLVTRPFTKAFTSPRFDAIKPLLLEQNYITGVDNLDGEVDYDFSPFRGSGCPWGRNITDIQSRYILGEDLPYEPWLKVDPDEYSSGRVIVHRSPRYHNQHSDWGKMLRKLGDRALSVGFQEEHAELEKISGRRIERVDLRDYLHLAQLIEGSDYFVGNQSSPLSVAIGLGKTAIQETCHWIPDCIYPKAPMQYITVGDVELDGERVTSSSGLSINKAATPVGGWIYEFGGVVFKNLILQNLVTEVCKVSGGNRLEVEEDVVRVNRRRLIQDYPESFGRKGYADVERLLRSVGIQSII